MKKKSRQEQNEKDLNAVYPETSILPYTAQEVWQEVLRAPPSDLAMSDLFQQETARISPGHRGEIFRLLKLYVMQIDIINYRLKFRFRQFKPVKTIGVTL